MRRWLLVVLWLGIFAFSPDAFAEPLSRVDVPEALQPWIDWSLKGHEKETCPSFHASSARGPCAWPARLELRLGDAKGSFRQEWYVHQEVWVALPGDPKHWPQNVRVDRKPAATLARKGRASVQLEPGKHVIEGEFLWDSLPELLQVPRHTGLIALQLRGEKVRFPRRDAQGQLWLQRRSLEDSDEKSRLEVVVHRLLADEIPVRLVTQIELRVSGKSREVILGRVLPDAFIPLSFASPIPARLEPDGHLRVQVRPGSWTIEIQAHRDAPVAALARPAPEGPWDGEEIWVFEAKPELRVVELRGAESVDPQQTQLPGGWRSFPAYLMEEGTTLEIEEKHRGDSDPVSDRLNLKRIVWLDFDGGGYTVSDTINGVINRSSRLEVQPDTKLGRITLNGQPQFITSMNETERAGIEVPRGNIQLEADSRITAGGRSKMPAVSWNHDFQAVSGVLHLPPGWSAFHISGVDDAGQTWIQRWDLLNLFMVLVITMAFFRLWGPAWGGVALVGLVLTFTEYGAPNWVWLHIVIAEALFRVVPEGRFEKWIRSYRYAAIVSLVLLSLAFAVSEIRTAVYPTLERPWHELTSEIAPSKQPEARPAAMAAPPADSAAGDFEFNDSLMEEAEAPRRNKMVMQHDFIGGKESYLGSSRSDSFGRLDRSYYKNTRITTGPGLPSWSWNKVDLRWSGPVDRDQELRFYLVSPLCNLFLAVLRVAFLVLLLACVVNLGVSQIRRLRAGSIAPLLILLIGSFAVPSAFAEESVSKGNAVVNQDYPGSAVLEELRRRLLEKPECHPHCAEISRLSFEFKPSSFSARMQADVAASSAIPLPVGTRDFDAKQVIVDGKPARALVREGNRLWIALEPGTHQILILGQLPPRETIEIPLPLKPHRVEVKASGWTVHGVLEDGLAEDNLQLSRIRKVGEVQEATLEPGNLPPFVRVERHISLGLTWRVKTSVVRMMSADSAIVLEVPLLIGESVTSEDVRIEGDRAQVSLGPGVFGMSWESVLAEAPELSLTASESVPWVEVWGLDVSPIWHVEATGIPIIHTPVTYGKRARLWNPWPGENVVLQITRPEGVEGRTVTIDHSLVQVSPGRRSTDTLLKLRLRSGQGGQHSIALPPGAEIQKTMINGQEKPLRKEGDTVSLPLVPGVQEIEIVWRERRGMEPVFRSSQIDLGTESVNTSLRFNQLQGRWSLLVGGPSVGPAVLFWPILLVFALIAIGLGRVPLTPLGWPQWLLLSIGLTQAPLLGATVVVAWFLVIGWRKTYAGSLSRFRFNAMQVILGLWTLAALGVLAYSIQNGLLGRPEMQISGNGSSSYMLQWYQDRSEASLPTAWVLSVPLLVYRYAMLAWALWLAQAMVRWMRWAWDAYSSGTLWLPPEKKGPKQEAP